MDSEKTGDDNYNDHHANHIENTHLFSPFAAIERSHNPANPFESPGDNSCRSDAERTRMTDRAAGSENT
jgi:hypothetical protein